MAASPGLLFHACIPSVRAAPISVPPSIAYWIAARDAVCISAVPVEIFAKSSTAMTSPARTGTIRANSVAAAAPECAANRLSPFQTASWKACIFVMVASLDKCDAAGNGDGLHPLRSAIGPESRVTGVINRVRDDLHASVLASESSVHLDMLCGEINRARHRRRPIAVEGLSSVRLRSIPVEEYAAIGSGGRRREANVRAAVELHRRSVGEIKGEAGSVDDGVRIQPERSAVDDIHAGLERLRIFARKPATIPTGLNRRGTARYVRTIGRDRRIRQVSIGICSRGCIGGRRGATRQVECRCDAHTAHRQDAGRCQLRRSAYGYSVEGERVRHDIAPVEGGGVVAPDSYRLVCRLVESKHAGLSAGLIIRHRANRNLDGPAVEHLGEQTLFAVGQQNFNGIAVLESAR